MHRNIFVSAAFVFALAACRDDRIPTAPQAAAPAIAPAPALSGTVASSGVSSICMVNRKALANLDGQLQDNPGNAALKAEYEVQSAITADVCD